jgi:alpha-L-fucosidase
MFIHWGLYSIPARGEWVRSQERLSVEDYDPYFREFDPDRYDPVAWARLAKRAGMKYAVLTAKHHDGFCLYDSKLTDYKATNTRAGRDLVREYLDAFRAEGLKVGLYYSLLDWHHPDYPAYGDLHHPMRDNEALKGKKIDFDRYLDYMHGQVRELCTDYGALDLLWFDFSYGEMRGEKWRATELVKMIRRLQPGVLIDNRLEGSGEGFGSLTTANPGPYAGDFVSPEQIIPSEGIRDELGRPVTWEACITLNNNWGYAAADHEWKSSTQVIRKLVECVSKGGNLLLNVGPTARGEIPSESARILEEVGAWLAANGESVYGCGLSEGPKPDWGRYTAKEGRLFAHVLDAPIGPLCFPDLAGKLSSARLLSDGSELKLNTGWPTRAYPRHAFVSLGPQPAGTYPLPDQADTVIELLLK